VIAPLGYAYTGKLAFICFGLSSKFFSLSLKPGKAFGTDKEERKMVGKPAFI
jgi:hypothetical protein